MPHDSMTFGLSRALAIQSQLEQLQAKFEPEKVLSPERLTSSEGTAKSLEAIEGLEGHLAISEQFFQEFMVQQVKQAAMNLKDGDDIANRERLLQLSEQYQWHLSVQSRFIAARKSWINAAKEICQIIEGNRSTIDFCSDTMLFRDDALLERFNELMSVIEAAHQEEVSIVEERRTRIDHALKVIGAAV